MPVVQEVVEDEGGGSDDALVEQRRADPARPRGGQRAAPVGRHKRRLGRRHRHVEIAMGVEPVDPERPDDANGDFHRADEILDIGAVAAGIGHGVRIGDGGPVGVTGGVRQLLPIPVHRGHGRPANRPQRGEGAVAGQHAFGQWLGLEPGAQFVQHADHMGGYCHGRASGATPFILDTPVVSRRGGQSKGGETLHVRACPQHGVGSSIS
jgi:hypothetical protein